MQEKKKKRPQKITRANRVAGVAQVTEYLSSKQEALSSNPDTEDT
jgi:hypothetical protein